MRLPSPALAVAYALATAATVATASTVVATPAAAQGPVANAARPVSGAVARWQPVVYRVTLTRDQEVMPMRVVVDRIGGVFDVMVLVGSSVSATASVEFDGTELRTDVLTSRGAGKLVLRDDGAGGVAGTLTIGRAVWTITGERSA